jgi:UV DNA damage endonuclease
LKLGYACIPLTTKARTNRRLVLKDYSEEKLKIILEENLKDLKNILLHNVKNNIYMFRISSDIVPLGSHKINSFHWSSCYEEKLREIGAFAKINSMRLSMHPGQYTVINSPIEDIVIKSIKDLEYHCKFLDSLTIDYTNKIVLHIGGVYGDKTSAKLRFISNFQRLSDSLKKRLVIENDEKNFSLDDVLEISNSINIPVIYDNLHNICYGDNNYNINEIYKKVKATWKPEDGSMKVHYSQQAEGKKRGAHSSTIFTKGFLNYYDEVKEFNPDIMLEVKDKDISAIKCIALQKELENNTLPISSLYTEWERYKYLVMEHGIDYYKRCFALVKNNCSFFEFYTLVDEAIKTEPNWNSRKNALEHLWEYVKVEASTNERNHFTKIMDEENTSKVKEYLEKLAIKYHSQNIIDSYFFSQY